MITFSPITVIPSFASNIFDPLSYPGSSTAKICTFNSSNPSFASKRTISTQTSLITDSKDTVLLINAALQLIQISDEFGKYLETIKPKQQNLQPFISRLFSLIKFAFVFFL